MTPHLLSVLSVALAYMVGAIPFAYLVVYAVKGVDIRTVGSGNVGATNAGRILGFRYFVFVFLLDLAKGLLPTFGFPWLVQRLTGVAVPWLGVAVALATILGHNFPVYLRFRGGKGVATSLGALSALDPVASGATVVAFIVFLLVTRYVSLSSVLGGVVFVAVHFIRVDQPWSRGEVAMSGLAIGLLGMLVVRHRKNFARIAAGSEPKVSFRKKRPPEGRIRPALLVGLAVLGVAGVGFAVNAGRRNEVDLGPYRLVEVARASTGHQRAERVAFLGGGRLVAVTCPRYHRVVIYRVTTGETLELFRDVALDGRPVALWAGRDRLYVLQRPEGDARHVEEGFWETFDFDGRPVGSRVRVGFDPDDMAITPDGRQALVLLSGHAEGETNRPAPALVTVALDEDAPRIVARLEFQGPHDDPERLILSSKGTHAAVTLAGCEQVAGIDLRDPRRPALTGRTSLAETQEKMPYLSQGEGESILMPAGVVQDAVVLSEAGRTVGRGGILACTAPEDSGLDLIEMEPLRGESRPGRRSLGRLRLHGPANLGSVRPTGLAYSPERRLIAVANRAGGIHLIAVRTADDGMLAVSQDAGDARR